MINILIVDDHAIVRKGIRQILLETSDKYAVEEACNGQEALEKVYKNNYDLVLMDISMPGRSGLDILKQLKQEKPKVPVIILSVYPEEQYAVRALKTGAAGYLTKESAPEELIRAIRKVSRGGGKYVTASIAEKLASAIGIDLEKLPHEDLSNREYQVLCMIASGKTATQISEELSLSVKTVSTYRTRILGKMGMKNNAELTHYAVKNSLV
ncbi:MAG: DNA-binding response regulator [Nitrospiraceae bacterium]|nr:MAG: DNA-binding response regulator [Nitrospiraceae bacterium]